MFAAGKSSSRPPHELAGKSLQPCQGGTRRKLGAKAIGLAVRLRPPRPLPMTAPARPARVPLSFARATGADRPLIDSQCVRVIDWAHGGPGGIEAVEPAVADSDPGAVFCPTKGPAEFAIAG